jgi:hypothetical protein
MGLGTAANPNQMKRKQLIFVDIFAMHFPRFSSVAFVYCGVESGVCSNFVVALGTKSTCFGFGFSCSTEQFG